MGAAPRSSPTPAQVAHSFVSVYYRVAAKLPNRLGEFYGGSSEIDHGEGFCASGAAIADLGDRLPIAGCAVTVHKLSAQPTGDGAFLVVVIGSYVKAAETVPFTQTFVLEKQVDSHDEHFFCRNDIFAPISENEENVVISFGEPSKAQAEAAAAHSLAPVAQGSSPDALPEVPAPSPVTPAKEARSAEPVSAEVLKPTVDSPEHANIEEVAPMPLPDNAVNGTVDHEEETVVHVDEIGSRDVPPPTADDDAAPETTATHAKETPLTETSLPNGGENTEPEAPEPAPAPPVKKTWASIVSSRDEVGNGPVSVSPSVTVDEPVAPKAAKEQLENVPPATESDNKNTQSGSHRSGSANGRAAHHVNRGNQRNFGPSAVVQLSALNQSQLQDTHTLVNSLRDEFGNYGHKLRNVDVKAQKEIAFVEYESLDGVKAAVAKWANGPRTDGAFAGVALQVSEKRGNGRGRASVRGRGRGRGRRPRPNSTPVS